MQHPLDKSKEDFSDIINRIKSDSSVGIDAQYTHAIIIEYLAQLNSRIESLEKRIETFIDK